MIPKKIKLTKSDTEKSKFYKNHKAYIDRFLILIHFLTLNLKYRTNTFLLHSFGIRFHIFGQISEIVSRFDLLYVYDYLWRNTDFHFRNCISYYLHSAFGHFSRSAVGYVVDLLSNIFSKQIVNCGLIIVVNNS